MARLLASGSPLADVMLGLFGVFLPVSGRVFANTTVFRQPSNKGTVFRRVPSIVESAPSRLPRHVHEVVWPHLGLAVITTRPNILAGVLGQAHGGRGRPNTNNKLGAAGTYTPSHPMIF
jgi:hypothetical protein